MVHQRISHTMNTTYHHQHLSQAINLPIEAPEDLPPEALCRIEISMAAWRATLAETQDAADSFRYEMFARRLQAAEYGRTDAVVWAWEWFVDLVNQDAANAELRAAKEEEAAAFVVSLKRQTRSEIARGYSANPMFQAFLDTLEDPEGELYREDGSFQGWRFLAWEGTRLSEPERKRASVDPTAFRAFLQRSARQFADDNLSMRVKAKRAIS